jgi:glucose/arabinose dehydrogenase
MMTGIPFARVPEVLALAVVLAGSPTWAEKSGGVIPGSEIALREIASGFSNLVAISHANDERLLLVEKDLGILVLSEGDVLPDPFLDISSLLGDGAFGNGGILSSAFHPQYPANGLLFVFYSNLINESVIARYEVSLNDPNVADPNSGVVLITSTRPVPAGDHHGGQLQFGLDGYLYSALGDGGTGGDPACRAQDMSLLHGKVLRVDVDKNQAVQPYYGIPDDNPFVGMGDAQDEVWAVGLRNPWRFSFDRHHGDLYIADVGQAAREEVNYIRANTPGGMNFGWKIKEGTTCFTPDPLIAGCAPGTPTCDFPDFTDPVLEYTHDDGDCSITGGYVYRGRTIRELWGKYLYGDWCSGNIWAASRNVDTGQWENDLLTVQLPGVTTFGEDLNGEIYLSNGASLFQLVGEAVFADGFESGDSSSWSPQSAEPPLPGVDRVEITGSGASRG